VLIDSRVLAVGGRVVLELTPELVHGVFNSGHCLGSHGSWMQAALPAPVSDEPRGGRPGPALPRMPTQPAEHLANAQTFRQQLHGQQSPEVAGITRTAQRPFQARKLLHTPVGLVSGTFRLLSTHFEVASSAWL